VCNKLICHSLSKKDLRKALEDIGEQVSEAQLRELIAEVDVNQNSTIEEEEFLIVSIYKIYLRQI